MLKSASKSLVNWPTKRKNNCAKFQLNAWMSTTSERKSWRAVGELSNVCYHIVLQCLYLARIGRPDIRWPENKLARAVTKWTRACDKRLARLISHIHHTDDYRQYCHVGNTAQHCRLGFFQDSDFCWRPWRFKINIRRNLVYLRKSNVRSHELDVQEANVSVSKFHGIRSYFFGCWIENGRNPCSRPLGCGNWSVAFNKQHWKTN